MADTMDHESPGEPILPEDVVAKIANIVREALNQPPQATIGAKATLGAPAQVIRLQGIASSESFASVTVRLMDPTESKKIWESPLGQILITLFGTLLIAFYTQWCADLSGQQIEEQREEFMRAQEEKNEVFMRGLLKQLEQFLHKEGQQPQSTPKPTPREMQQPTCRNQTFS